MLCVLYVLNQPTHNKLINKCNILLFSPFILCMFEHIPLARSTVFFRYSIAAYFESQKVVAAVNVAFESFVLLNY
jgi:hypothetical protein